MLLPVLSIIGLVSATISCNLGSLRQVDHLQSSGLSHAHGHHHQRITTEPAHTFSARGGQESLMSASQASKDDTRDKVVLKLPKDTTATPSELVDGLSAGPKTKIKGGGDRPIDNPCGFKGVCLIQCNADIEAAKRQAEPASEVQCRGYHYDRCACDCRVWYCPQSPICDTFEAGLAHKVTLRVDPHLAAQQTESKKLPVVKTLGSKALFVDDGSRASFTSVDSE